MAATTPEQLGTIREEVAAQFGGWHLWETRDTRVPMATRISNLDPSADDDGVWSATLMAKGPGDWPDLIRQLSEQARHDAELSAARM